MRQDNIDRGAQIQTEVRGYVDKAKTQTPNHLWHFTVFRPEHIQGILRMLECRQRFAVFVDLNAHRCDISKHLKWALVINEPYALISLHSFFAGYTLVFRHFD